MCKCENNSINSSHVRCPSVPLTQIALVSTCVCPGPGPLRSNIASVLSPKTFWTDVRHHLCGTFCPMYYMRLPFTDTFWTQKPWAFIFTVLSVRRSLTVRREPLVVTASVRRYVSKSSLWCRWSALGPLSTADVDSAIMCFIIRTSQPNTCGQVSHPLHTAYLLWHQLH